MPTRALGLLPATPAVPRLKLSRYLGSRITLTPPDAVDYITRVPSWDMHANDQYGDCGPISVANAVEAAGAYGDGTPLTPTTDQILRFYSTVTGFDRATGANDNGVVMSEMLNVARKSGGPGGSRVLVFAEVNVADLDEMRAALNVFGHLLFGINLPVSAQTQLDAGARWDVVDGTDGIPGGWGGHAVHVGAYTGNLWTCTTWGQTQEMTDDFLRRYLGEAWVVVTPEWFAANGKSPTGVDLHGIGAEFSRLTGEANPFPAPYTPPAGPPIPEIDGTSIDAADRAMWGKVVEWVHGSRRYGANRVTQSALKAWAESKALDDR